MFTIAVPKRKEFAPKSIFLKLIWYPNSAKPLSPVPFIQTGNHTSTLGLKKRWMKKKAK
ncbi:hypothetical protein L6273_04235 [Candidatus Parcubacteria bacterium]|nr:hypothetical protein [Candidatus Parcubacteria bacterium]